MSRLYGIRGLSGTDEDKIYGVVTGIVKENWSSDNPGKIKAEILMGKSGENVTGWIPVMTPYAGNGFGNYFLPEVGTEVIIAFYMGDRNCPVVIGNLWNDKNTLPTETANDKNSVKCLRTKGGCEILFSEESGKEKIQIETPGKMTILLEDEKQKISLQAKDDKNGIIIDAKEGTITLNASKKLLLKAGGNDMIVLSASPKKAQIESDSISVSAKNDLTLEGQSLKESGTTLEVTGKSGLTLQSNAITQVKGSMVKING